MFRDGWIEVNETPTHVLTWGGWIEDEINSDSIIVCIPGNPGITYFYSVFLSSLHKETGIPVWVINHAGLEFPPLFEKMFVPSLKSKPHLFNLEGQICHKLNFIRRFAGINKKLYLIGHSVGAKMVTGLLESDRALVPCVQQAYFLFPTLEFIAKSPYGKFVVKYGSYLSSVSMFLSWFLNIVPSMLKRWIIRAYLRMRIRAEPTDNIVEAALQLVKPDATRTALFLANDKMTNIKEPDLGVLQELGDRVNCYYGEKDGWAPVWQSEDIKRLCSKASVTVLDKKHKHAFVLSSPLFIANIISEHIKTTNNKEL